MMNKHIQAAQQHLSKRKKSAARMVLACAPVNDEG
jgi:hypothetical protein